MKRRDAARCAMVHVLVAGLSVPASAAAPAAADPLAPLAWLAGNCYTGTFGDGKTKDFICYEWVFERKFLRSRHRVVGGEEAYAGETLVAFDKATGALGYAYYNSRGDVLRGEVLPTADGVAFPAEGVTIGGESAEIRSSWQRRGPDGYVAVSERRFGDDWRVLFTIEFVRDAVSAGVDRLAPLRHLAGGVWVGSGTWPDGSPLRVATRYFWGPTDQVLHFETYDLSGGERRILYEGLLFSDPQRQAVAQWNFKTDGTRDESVLESLDEKGFSVAGPRTRSRVDFVAADEMRWELDVPAAAGGWQRILEATYRRQAEGVTQTPSPPR